MFYIHSLDYLALLVKIPNNFLVTVEVEAGLAVDLAAAPGVVPGAAADQGEVVPNPHAVRAAVSAAARAAARAAVSHPSAAACLRNAGAAAVPVAGGMCTSPRKSLPRAMYTFSFV